MLQLEEMDFLVLNQDSLHKKAHDIADLTILEQWAFLCQTLPFEPFAQHQHNSAKHPSSFGQKG
jgi:predicted nucleotide-binding protein (sugar kinase/HSP70/actin superfamily)